jgi:hypothetical protein
VFEGLLPKLPARIGIAFGRKLLSKSGPNFVASSTHWPMEAVEQGLYFVISSEARNLYSIEDRKRRNSSARSPPRNDKKLSFSASGNTPSFRVWRA